MLSLLKRKDSPAAAGATDEAGSVQAARTRARRRLIGAAVLLGMGIIGFPLLFETQPRPIAVDIPIEIPSRDAVPPLKPPPPKSAASVPQREPVPVIVETEPAAPVAPAVAASAPPAKPVLAASALAATDSAASAAARSAPSAAQREAERAQALLEGRPAASASDSPASAAKPPRFVVQAGAYTDPAALREARQKVEKLGLKTYTQVIEAGGSARTRVRVGPFESREEAEAAAARIKSAGLAVSILSL